jgi:hypothetical protein
VYEDPVPIVIVGQDREEFLPVLIVQKDVFLLIASAGDVVEGSGVFYAQWSSHKLRLSPLLSHMSRPDTFFSRVRSDLLSIKRKPPFLSL